MATRIETRATPAVVSLTDEMRRRALIEEYGEGGGLERWLIESITLEEKRIRDGVPGNRMQTDPDAWLSEVRQVEDYIARRYGLEDELRNARRSRGPNTTRSRPASAEPVQGWTRNHAKPERKQWWPDQDTIPVYFVSSDRPVSISDRAAREIRAECERWDGNVETGGGLLINRDGGSPRIIDATVGATEREVGSVRVDMAEIRANTRQRARQATARLAPGHWHTHPGRASDPSEQDLHCWARFLDKSDANEIVALIVTEHPAGGWWRTPQFHAFRVAYGRKPSGVECLRVERCDVRVA